MPTMGGPNPFKGRTGESCACSWKARAYESQVEYGGVSVLPTINRSPPTIAFVTLAGEANDMQ
jgi:hypothetical protein